MEVIYFVLVAVALYAFSDWLVRRLERLAGGPLEHRSVIFFGLLLGSALIAFALIRYLLAG